jgi:hypothetical protein
MLSRPAIRSRPSATDRVCTRSRRLVRLVISFRPRRRASLTRLEPISKLPEEEAKFPAKQGKEPAADFGVQSVRKFKGLLLNSLRNGTGNFWQITGNFFYGDQETLKPASQRIQVARSPIFDFRSAFGLDTITSFLTCGSPGGNRGSVIE